MNKQYINGASFEYAIIKTLESEKSKIYMGNKTKIAEYEKLFNTLPEKERNSFKSFTDMAYGYYDKDSQSQLNNT